MALLRNRSWHIVSRWLAIVVLPLILLSGLFSFLTNSYLDPGFGTGGIVTTYVGANVYGTAMLLQPDEKIVVAGYAGASQIVLARYTPSGTLDTSFGTQGIVLTITGSLGALARQSDGKLVLVGSQFIGSPDFYAFQLMRYTITGTVDSEFGTNGVVVTPISLSSRATSVVIQPDGKIIAAGGTGWRSSKIAVARYNTDGSLDTAFATSGTLVIDLGRYDLATSLALQADGKIVVAGNSSERMVVVRCTVSGTLDTSFNATGIVTTSLPGRYPRIWGVALQSGGKIVVAGDVTNGGGADNILLARYTTTGTLDMGFGLGGIVTTSIDSGTDRASSLVLQPDDKIVIGGVSFSNAANRSNFMAARYTPAGMLDITFGSGGVVTSSIGLSYSVGSSVAVQPDGKIVLAGHSSDDGFKNNLTVARYLSTTFPNSVYLPVIRR